MSTFSYNNKSSKVGRNAQCPCGSGQKFKQCHGAAVKAAPISITAPSFEVLSARIEAQEFQRKKQQGLGRPIISSIDRGIRTVIVGESYRLSNDKWQTFHDFLFDFIKIIFDQKWMAGQLNLPKNQQHLLVSWIQQGGQFMKDNGTISGSIRSSCISGSLMGLIDLSYSLYVVEHNCGIPPLVKKRLLDNGQFLAALYEMWLASSMIQAGFKLEFEDESDSTTKHCEFTAFYPSTNKYFSVEAKRRIQNDQPEKLGRPLKKALLKNAKHTRLIAIEANLAIADGVDPKSDLIKSVLAGLRHREEKAPFTDRDADPAYVIVTNSPYQHHPNVETSRWAIAEGYKIPDFKYGAGFATVRNMVDTRDRHVEVFDLMQSMSIRSVAPSTFDGEMPDLVFGKSHARLMIGEWYNVPGPGGVEMACQLEEVCMMETEAMCIMRTPHGKNHICCCPLTEDELRAYKAFPETFFGRVDKGGTARDPLDIYDFILKSYSHNSKDHLLKLLKDHPSVGSFAHLSQPDIARLYAEWITECSIDEGMFTDQVP